MTLRVTPARPGRRAGPRDRPRHDLAAIIEKAQKGQRLARGLSIDGKTEEEARAEAHAENRTLIDIFIEAIKDTVPDPAVRDRLREAILVRLPVEDDDTLGEPEAA